MLDAAGLAADARHARGQVGLMLEEVEMPPGFPRRVVGRTVGRAAGRTGEPAAGGEVDLDVEPMRLGVEVGAADGPRRGQGQRQLQQGCVAHGLASVTSPVLFEPDAGGGRPQGRCAPLRGGPRAILDRGCSRRHGDLQAGTKKRRVVSRTKKHNEVGSKGGPSKGRSSLPMLDVSDRSAACRNDRQDVRGYLRWGGLP
jgi:hypothetical protein